MSGEAKVMVGVTSWQRDRAKEFREIAHKAGGREFVLKQMALDGAETSARFGRLSHQTSFTGEDRQYVGAIADWLHDQGFLCTVTQDGSVIDLLVSWAGQPSSEEP